MEGLSISEMLAACSAVLEAVPLDGVAAYVATCHRRLGACIGSGEGHVVLVVRSAMADDDPLCGFRPHASYQIGSSSVQHTPTVDRLLKEEALLLRDPGLRRIARDHGRHRTYHDPDPRSVPELSRSLDAMFWETLGLSDRLKVVHPVGDQLELHLGFDRFVGEPRFDEENEAALAALSLAISPWARRVMFLHGYGCGLAPFSPRERETLCLLLGERAQKQHAQALGVSEARARELVRDLYAKLGVCNRSEIMAQWLTGVTVGGGVPVTEAHAARRPAAARGRRTTRR